MTEHNGWKNYETWITYSWITNEEGSYLHARDLAASATELPVDSQTAELAAILKDWQDQNLPDLGAGLAADLLGSAFGEIDWYRIAEHLLEEVTQE